MDKRALLRRMFDAAIAAAAPGNAVPANLPPPPSGRTVVVGAGKAAASMARAVEAHWPDDLPLAGLVVTRYGHGVGPLERIEVVEASHPVPDAAGRNAAERILERRARSRPRGPCAVPDLGRRVGAPLPAGAWNRACRQAGRQPRAAQERRGDQRHELRPQTSLRHQGGPARSGRGARPGRIADHFRRAGRRSLGDRLRPHRSRREHAR